ncbi:MAG: hypothetical protein OEX02_18940 [Cyclobacteriaceae bacterium]|nr:hypothetical protein [Cyclobacteriaceae bacterium]
MKKLIIFLCMSMAISLVAFAGKGNDPGKNTDSNAKFAVVDQGKSMVKFCYTNDLQSKVKFTLLDEKGHTLLIRIVKNTEGFMQNFNFGALPDGKYVLKIIDDQGTIIQEVNHKRITPVKADVLTTLLNDGSPDRYRLSVYSQNDNPISIGIYNRLNKLVYEDKVSSTNAFGRVYDLSQVLTGPFSFRISNGETTKFITIN